jgi:hypothetical protein
MHPEATHLALTYDDGDFTYSPMVTSYEQARERAVQLASVGKENVTLTHYRMKGKKRVVLHVESFSPVSDAA